MTLLLCTSFRTRPRSHDEGLGMLYKYGLGVSRVYEKVWYCNEVAAVQGNAACSWYQRVLTKLCKSDKAMLKRNSIWVVETTRPYPAYHCL